MYIVTNKLPQPINLLLKGSTLILKPYESTEVEELTPQIINLSNKWFIRVGKVKSKKN